MILQLSYKEENFLTTRGTIKLLKDCILGVRWRWRKQPLPVLQHSDVLCLQEIREIRRVM